MILKIKVALCAMMLIKECCGCTRRDASSRNSYDQSYCKVSASEVTSQKWYHAEMFLKVSDGTFTVELLSNHSAPSSLNAEERGIVRLNRGFARISSLEWLSLEANLIERIDGSVFAGLTGLIYLNLARNRIAYLEEDSFQGLSKLEFLILNHNSLSRLSDSINDVALPKLTELYLQHNQLSQPSDDDDYDDDYYNDYFELCHSNLEQLYLSNNSIRSFVPDHNRRPSPCLKNLTHLSLEDNRITNFAIGNMPLETLSLDGNDLDQIPAINPQLQFISLARNRISSMRDLEDADNIVSLILSYNMLWYMENWRINIKFHNLSSLQFLALDNNFIRSIGDEFFYNLPSLRSLYLNGNKISEISPKAFADLPALRQIFLENNELKSFPGNESFGQSKLEYLDLSKNKVENFSDLQANMIPELKILKLTGNPLKRIDTHSVPDNITIFLLDE